MPKRTRRASDLVRVLNAPGTIGPLTARPRRVVDSQHLFSTRKLVDSGEEQRLLDELLESRKPPGLRAAAKLHYLLATPFRYPPLAWGSRFATRLESGLWYGSIERRTAFAETGYHRLSFAQASRAELIPLELELTVFRARVRTARGVDLTAAPFSDWRDELASKIRYDLAQALGRAMREAGVEAFRYVSARDVRGGTKLGVLSPAALAERKPGQLETWVCLVERERVEFFEKSHFRRRSLAFSRSELLVQSRFRAPNS